MLGTIPAPGDKSMLDLGSYLTEKEQLNFAQLTALTVDPTAGSTKNMASYIDQPAQLGAIVIVAKGASSAGTNILSTTAYINGAKTDVDLYRLPLA